MITACILFQSQSPLSLLFEVEMDQLTEDEKLKVGIVQTRYYLLNVTFTVADW